ncbi:MAG: hypothetical protein ACYST6_09370, partial [Planctomycetota bacterium]
LPKNKKAFQNSPPWKASTLESYLSQGALILPSIIIIMPISTASACTGTLWPHIAVALTGISFVILPIVKTITK